MSRSDPESARIPGPDGQVEDIPTAPSLPGPYAGQSHDHPASSGGRDEGAGRAAPVGTVWITGLSGAGKTTLAIALEHALHRDRIRSHVLDGDRLREGLSRDLGLSRADRAEQARRTSYVAAILAQAGIVAIVALVSPYGEDRRRAREVHDQGGLWFIEVWIDTPLAVCERRDPKGLYARSRAGQLQGLTGLDAPYERPLAMDARVDGARESPGHAAERIAALVAGNCRFHSALATRGETAESVPRLARSKRRADGCPPWTPSSGGPSAGS